MNVVPVACDAARPVVFIVATDGDDDDHVACEVRSWVRNPPAAKVAVAVYCCVVPSAILALEGATAIEATSAEVSCVLPVIALKVAEIVAIPVVDPAVASPLSEMLAVADGAAVHVTKLEIFCVAVFARVPVAAYWMVVPFAITWFAGVTAMEARPELVRTVEPVKPAYEALTVAVPVVDNTALTSPSASTVAIAVLLEVHVARLVTLLLALFEYSPSARICKVVPGAMLGDGGLIAIDWRTGGGGGCCSFTPPQPERNRRHTVIAAKTAFLLFFMCSHPLRQASDFYSMNLY